MHIKGFNIRRAQKSDIDRIMKIEEEAFLSGIKEDKNIFIERMNVFNEGFLVLVDENNSPVSYISTEIWNYKDKIDENNFKLGHSIKERHNFNGNEIYISSMALDNKLRGKGYGHILFDYLIDTIKIRYPNLKTAILIVCSYWKTANKIYKSRGFDEIYVIKDFFNPLNGDKGDGIVMRKEL